MDYKKLINKLEDRVGEINSRYNYWRGAFDTAEDLLKLIGPELSAAYEQEQKQDQEPKKPATKKKPGRKRVPDERVKELFDSGLTSKQIAEELGMTVQTVNKKLLAIKAEEVRNGN